MVIGGVETVVLKGNKFRREPRLWLRNGAAWDRTVLPRFGSSTEGQVNDLNADTLVVGNTPGGATVWSHGPGGLDSGRHRTDGQRRTRHQQCGHHDRRSERQSRGVLAGRGHGVDRADHLAGQLPDGDGRG